MSVDEDDDVLVAVVGAVGSVVGAAAAAAAAAVVVGVVADAPADARAGVPMPSNRNERQSIPSVAAPVDWPTSWMEGTDRGRATAIEPLAAGADVRWAWAALARPTRPGIGWTT